jgi:hypothetical protein
MKSAKRVVLSAMFLAWIGVPYVSAFQLVTVFVGGNPPANAAGGGDLMAIVNAAARTWESAYSDDSTLILYVGWGPVGDAGIHLLLEQGGHPNRETVGVIFFDNSGIVPFYMDPTPESNEEFGRLTAEYQDLGGGFVNVARVFSKPSGDAAGRVDLFSVAIHEIGHALGLCNANTTFLAQRAEGALRITAEFPYAGTVIPLAVNNSGVTSHIDATLVLYGSVMQGINSDERRIPSALDILANAQLSGFSILTLNPQEDHAVRGILPATPVARSRVPSRPIR